MNTDELEKNTTTQFLKFKADWCVPCKSLSSTIETLAFSEGFDTSTIKDIDIEEQPDTAIKYNVRGIPTIIKVDGEGNEVERITGSPTLVKLRKFLGAEPSEVLA